jgi:hypothetical protein
MKVAVTFDLDLVDYTSGGFVDEFELCFPLFQNFCIQNPWLKTTWFIRIDDQIAHRFGRADYIFVQHKDKLDWLLDNGHELGWHFHSYVKDGNNWIQNTNESAVVDELNRNFAKSQKYNMDLLRMGWTYHTNLTMQAINNFDLMADCSALPRPNYQWDMAKRDWENTPEQPYFPSVTDYRIPGTDCYATPEFPISVAQISSPYDTEPNVLRYINPCYHAHIFQMGLNNFKGEYLNIIAHPYEFLSNEKPHGLLAFNTQIFFDNLNFLNQNNYTTCTMGEMVKDYLLNS